MVLRVAAQAGVFHPRAAIVHRRQQGVPRGVEIGGFHVDVGVVNDFLRGLVGGIGQLLGHDAAVGCPGGGIVGALCAGGFGGVIAAVLTADAAAACQQYSRQQGSGYAEMFFHGGCSFLFHGFSRVASSHP